MSEIFNRGDRVKITSKEKTTTGYVTLISDNQVSALITFEGMLGCHAGAMPVMRHDRQLGIYRSIIDGTEITMRHHAAAKEEGKPNGQTTP